MVTLSGYLVTVVVILSLAAYLSYPLLSGKFLDFILSSVAITLCPEPTRNSAKKTPSAMQWTRTLKSARLGSHSSDATSW